MALAFPGFLPKILIRSSLAIRTVAKLSGEVILDKVELKAAEKVSVAPGSLINCTQATTTAGEQRVPLIFPTCVQMQMHVRADKTTAVSRTARRREVIGRACR